jgi:hypothetical protein
VKWRRRDRDPVADLAAAKQEAARSRERLAHIRETVVRPLREAGEHNQFAEMIKVSLMEGRPK